MDSKNLEEKCIKTVMPTNFSSFQTAVRRQWRYLVWAECTSQGVSSPGPGAAVW